MVPSVVGRRVEEDRRSYLTLDFEPSNPFFSGIVRTFASQPGNLDLDEMLNKRNGVRPFLVLCLTAKRKT